MVTSLATLLDDKTNFVINGRREEDDVVGCLCFGIYKVSLLQSVKSHVVQKKT